MAPKTDEIIESMELVASSVDQFGTHFYKLLSNDIEGNVVCSPLSVNIVLGMLSYGTAGSTQKQLHDVLGINVAEQTTKTGYANLISSFNITKDADLIVANKLFSSSSILIKSDYLELSKTIFKCSVESVNFSDSKAAAKTINSWCMNQTRNKITKIVDPSELYGDTTLILANAIYFKGQWKDKFDPLRTTEMPFYTDKSNFKNVPMMKKTSSYNNGFIDELSASFIELPYQGDELSMVIILPVEFGGLKHIKNNIDTINITEVLKTGRNSKVELHLPKFKIETEIDLQSTLKKMGIDEIFTSSANFSNMSDVSMNVSKAVQKAFIIVNEEGSEAAAVTSIRVCRSAILPKCFSINQPFIFQLVKIVRNKDDVRIALPLFAGVVQEPKFDD